MCSVHVKATQNFSFLIVFEYGDNYLKRIFYLDKMIFSKSLVLSALVESLITKMGKPVSVTSAGKMHGRKL